MTAPLPPERASDHRGPENAHPLAGHHHPFRARPAPRPPRRSRPAARSAGGTESWAGVVQVETPGRSRRSPPGSRDGRRARVFVVAVPVAEAEADSRMIRPSSVRTTNTWAARRCGRAGGSRPNAASPDTSTSARANGTRRVGVLEVVPREPRTRNSRMGNRGRGLRQAREPSAAPAASRRPLDGRHERRPVVQDPPRTPRALGAAQAT